MTALGINVDGVFAEAYRHELENVERFSGLIAAAEKRRRKAIEHVEKYQHRKLERAKRSPHPVLELVAEETSAIEGEARAV